MKTLGVWVLRIIVVSQSGEVTGNGRKVNNKERGHSDIIIEEERFCNLTCFITLNLFLFSLFLLLSNNSILLSPF
jgi:hypothetical protein